MKKKIIAGLAVLAALGALLGLKASAQGDDVATLYNEINARGNLIIAQENLLNAYRCRYSVDLEIVPGGCSNGIPRETLVYTPYGQSTPETAPSSPHPTSVPATDQTYQDWSFLADTGDGITLAITLEPGEYSWADPTSLVVRCDSSFSELEVFAGFPSEYIATGSFGVLTVTYSIRPAGIRDTSTAWSTSTDDNAVFSPNPVALARQIAKNGGRSSSMTVNVNDALDDSIGDTFSLNGAETAVRHVLTACGH